MGNLKPSFFMARGIPRCSKWGKFEIENVAFDYVSALVENGDEWKELDFKQVYPEKHQQNGYRRKYFPFVKETLSTEEGALTIGGFWRVPN